MIPSDPLFISNEKLLEMLREAFYRQDGPQAKKVLEEVGRRRARGAEGMVVGRNTYSYREMAVMMQKIGDTIEKKQQNKE